MSDIAAQNFIVETCEKIQTLPCNAVACKASNSLLARPETVECWLKDFHTWHNRTYNGQAIPSDETFYDRLKLFRSHPSNKKKNGSPWKNEIGFIGGKLKYIAITFTSSLRFPASSGAAEPVYEVAKAFVNELKDIAPPSASSIIQEAGWQWTWMRSEQGLVQGVFLGFSICFPAVFLVLLFATKNLLLACYATLSIAAIVGCVLGFCNYGMGWDLGAAESISAVIVIGFSVDYVVHLGHIYIDARHVGKKSRIDRFKYASEMMGTTVVAGAITTMGSGLFMFGCQMIFFYKMAVLITLTIFLSLLFSLGFFMALVVVAGPSDDFAMIAWFNKKKD